MARGFLHRRFAGMLGQFAVDNEIDRSQKEAEMVGRAVRLAIARVDMYLTVRNLRASKRYIYMSPHCREAHVEQLDASFFLLLRMITV